MKKTVKNSINLRAAFLYFFLVAASILIIIKILYVQELRTDLKKLNQPKLFDIQAPRGNIFSDNGSLLAISMPLYDIHVDMTVINEEVFKKHLDSLCEGIHRIFKEESDKSALDYSIDFKKARQESNMYFFLRSKVTHTQLRELKKLPIFNLGKFKGGLIAEQRTNREKPFGVLAKRTIGILRDANPVGIERAFHKSLSGVNGKQLKHKIDGIWMPKTSQANKLPIPGNDIYTTINIDIQDIAHDALRKSLLYNNANWGCAIVMRVNTGEVKAIVNLKKDTNDVFDEHFNYAIGEHSEPGSTFKLASLIAGLEDGHFNIADSVDTGNGKYNFHDKTMIDSKPGGHGKITIGEAFVVSSNVGISKAINSAYEQMPKSFSDRVYKMGLSNYLKLELPYPDNFLMKKYQNWSGVSLPWMSIGYEMQITPLHILTFYNAIANDGRMLRPLFTVNKKNEFNKIVVTNQNIISASICSKSTIDKVIPLLVDVVEEGTATRIKDAEYKIAGKTGTTLLDYGKSNSRDKKKYQASFVGFFPAENPKYSCIVVVNNPTNDYYSGGNVAAPVFREISDKIYAFDIDMHNSINGNEEGKKLDSIIKKITYSDMNNQKSEHAMIKENLSNGIMPNLVNMNIKNALPLLEESGLKVRYSGFKSINNQSIIPGHKFKEGSIVYLN